MKTIAKHVVHRAVNEMTADHAIDPRSWSMRHGLNVGRLDLT